MEWFNDLVFTVVRVAVSVVGSGVGYQRVEGGGGPGDQLRNTWWEIPSLNIGLGNAPQVWLPASSGFFLLQPQRNMCHT